MKFINTLKDIWNIKELKDKLLLTLGLIAVYRFMAAVPLPGIDPTKLTALANRVNDGSLLSLLNAFTGGAFSKASVMALGIMPYISASIVVQLMGIAVPYLQKLQKDGESGRKKITQITRWLTIVITLFQGPGYIAVIRNQMGLPPDAFVVGASEFWISSMILLTTGTIFAMWLGERITEKGVGNGISLLITVGIMARFPAAFIQEFYSKTEIGGAGGFMMILIEIIVWLVVILLTVLLVTAVRRVMVQYARRTAITNIKDVDGARQYIPLKLNASGVMPIIFAQAIMFLPMTLGQKFPALKGLTDNFGWEYNLVFAILIIIFSYFYTAITIPTNKMADDLKRSNGFIPGYQPGEETAEYLDGILSKITFPGSIFLALIAILPAIIIHFDVKQAWAMFYGGTSLIIMVGVAIDTIQQINSYLLNSRYDNLMKKGGTKRKSLDR